MYPVFQQAAAHARLMTTVGDDQDPGRDMVLFIGECLQLLLQDDGRSPPSLTVKPLCDWRGPDGGAAAAALGAVRVVHAEQVRALEGPEGFPRSNREAIAVLRAAANLDALAVAELPPIRASVARARAAHDADLRRFQASQEIGLVAKSELVDEVVRLEQEGLLSAMGLENLREIAQRLACLREISRDEQARVPDFPAPRA